MLFKVRKTLEILEVKMVLKDAGFKENWWRIKQNGPKLLKIERRLDVRILDQVF